MRVFFLFFFAVSLTAAGFAQVLADFETPATTPALTPAGAEVRANPDMTGNLSATVAYYPRPAGNWHAVYLGFTPARNIGKNDRLTFKLRSGTAGRVYVKVVNGATVILEAWAPEYNFMPAPNTWTTCVLDVSAIKEQSFTRLEVNASVDNMQPADVYLDDFELSNSLSPNGEPVIEVSTNPNPVVAGNAVTVDASESYDPEGTIVSYEWDFGDGVAGTGPLVTHAYDIDGIYEATLVITDDDGKHATKTWYISVLPASGKLGAVTVFTPPIVNSRIEIGFLLTQTYGNVYDPDEVKVDAHITLPDASTITVPCFYFQKSRYNAAGDQWSIDGSLVCWMLRFSSGQSGTHTVTLQVTDADGVSNAEPVEVTVTPSALKGTIQRDETVRQHYRHTTGEPYVPLGINAGWGSTAQYNKILTNLATGGANFVRYWQAPFDRQGLEWKAGVSFYEGLGRYSQEAAAEQDSIMDLCESLGLYLQMTIFQHGMFSENVDSNWNDNPYNAANGGPLTTAEQYFYNSTARAYTRKLLRYIVARWGYATHLFAWELFNEVNFTGFHPMQTSQWKTGVVDWHNEMSTYIKSIDAFHHIVTTSSDDVQLEAMNDLDQMDVLQYHLYNTNLLIQQTAQDKKLLGTLFNKAVINGEYGLNVSTADVPFDVQRVAIWTGIMSRVPHVMWKWDNYTDPVWGALFETPYAYLDDEDFGAQGALTDWLVDASLNAASLTGLGFHSDQNFYGLVYHPSFNNNITTATLRVDDLPPAHYNATFYDIVTGTQYETGLTAYPHATPIVLPEFSHAIAIKLKFASEITAPIANGGPDVHASAGSVLQLSGENSYDPASAELTYQWSLLQKPDGSATTLGVANNTRDIVFTPDLPGEYLLTLVVSNGALSSEPDEVVVTVDQVTSAESEQPGGVALVYPNPTSGRVTLISNSSWVTLRVLKATGEMVWTSPVNSAGSLDVDLQKMGLASGVYIFQVVTNSGSTACKVILTH